MVFRLKLYRYTIFIQCSSKIMNSVIGKGTRKEKEKEKRIKGLLKNH